MIKLSAKVFILFFFLYSTALCATITVTNTNDSGAGSFRQAIADAAADDTIDFSVTGTITLVSQLTIAKNLTITGPGPSSLTISGNNSYRIFLLNNSSTTINISGLTITNGYFNTYGGGIENEATLNITNCVVSNCRADGSGNGFGGGIDNYNGTVTITDCRITGNHANNEGGGVCGFKGSIDIIDSTIEGNTSDNGGGFSQISAGAITMTRSTISGNHATNGSNKNGGGIICKAGSLTLTNCTVSGNDATNGGGIIDGTSSAATINILNCTIANNSAVTRGGGIEFNKSTANIKNTILAANTAPSGANFYNSDTGALNSQGYNLCDAALAGFGGTGDQTSATLNIAALADNGGSTKTHRLNAGSDAIDAIPEGGNSYNGSPATDQRGTARPQGTNADVGAFEATQGPTVTTTTATSVTSTGASSGGNVTADGGANVTARGVCWSTSINPTTADSSTSNGTGTGSFTSSITGLDPGTEYHYRAYAVNSVGTSYGNDETFTTAEEEFPWTLFIPAILGSK